MTAHEKAEEAVGVASGPHPWRASEAIRRQTVWLIAALVSGGAALYFNYAERIGQELQRRATGFSIFLPAAGIVVAMVVICRVRDLLFLGTEGTGIPQVMASMEMSAVERSRVLSLRVAIGKLFLLTLGLLSGATIGREGPSVHVAACFLHQTTRLARFPRHLVERGLILAGAAAGIGAAFNTPVAAIIFAFEEVGRSFDKKNVGTIVRTVIVACVLCWIPLSNYLFYGRLDVQLSNPSDAFVVVAVGLVGGLLGGGFAQVVVSAAAIVRQRSRRNPYLVAAGLGGALAILGMISSGESYGSGYTQAHAILIEGESLPIWYPFSKAAGLFVSLISGIPGGLFDPTLSVGAALGQLTWPAVPDVNRSAFILLTMGAYFAAVVQSPITAAVILVEMTAADRMLLPLLATTIVAYEVSRLVCRTSLYEALAQAFLEGRKA